MFRINIESGLAPSSSSSSIPSELDYKLAIASSNCIYFAKSKSCLCLFAFSLLSGDDKKLGKKKQHKVHHVVIESNEETHSIFHVYTYLRQYAVCGIQNVLYFEESRSSI